MRAKQNYIDNRVTDQSSILRFTEDNWRLGRIGNGSTDAIAGTLQGMFDFDDRPQVDSESANGVVSERQRVIHSMGANGRF
jgi:phospholipase C